MLIVPKKCFYLCCKYSVDFDKSAISTAQDLQHNKYNMRVLEKLFDIVAPYDCLVCGEESRLICAWCWPDSLQANPSRCYLCLRASSGCSVCSKCQPRTPIRYLWAATNYSSVAKTLVGCMKYHQQRQAAVLIAQKLNETVPYLSDVVISYVPSASSRLRQRSFDHSRLIAKEFARLRGLDFAPVLMRRNQLRQVGHTRTERIKQAEGAYRAINPRFISKKRIILIDDVLTTGATIEEAAKTLKRAGAKSVDAAIFAQAI